jgi:hypothetical protein
VLALAVSMFYLIHYVLGETMKRYKKDQKIRLSNLQLLNVTKNVHNLIFNNAHIYLKQNELKTDGKIENIHRQIVLELLDRINKCACINDAINLINE